MCGRYYIDAETADEIRKIVSGTGAGTWEIPTGDICPSREAAVLTGNRGNLSADKMAWGFPGYDGKGLLINARSETVLKRPTFRNSVLYRRCIIPARHFYEWDKQKNKVSFFLPDKSVLYLAGFYQRFRQKDCFMILTTQANPSVEKVHHRMPLILEAGEITPWIFDRQFLDFALQKEMPDLEKYQEYEQQTFSF